MSGNIAPHPIRRAMEARDHAAVVAALAPEVVFHTAVAARPFEGREAVGELFAAVLEAVEELHYTHESRDGDRLVLGFRLRVGGRWVEGLEVLELTPDGLVRSGRLHGRPLSGVGALAAAVGPRLVARRRGRGAALAARAGLAPLPALLRFSDRAGEKLLKPLPGSRRS